MTADNNKLSTSTLKINFGLIGFNHHRTAIAQREKLAVANDRYATIYNYLRQNKDVLDLLLLSTCNRLEIYYTTYKADIADFIKDSFLDYQQVNFADLQCYSYSNKEALRHLWAVAGGLDSLVLGETQILGQLKQAFRLSDNLQKHTPFFRRVFESAYRTAKQVRSQVEISGQNVSIGKVAISLAQQVLGELTTKNVLLIGAGDVAETTLKYLCSMGIADIHLANRSLERASKLANQYRATIIPLEKVEVGFLSSDLVISSVSSSSYLFDYDHMLAIMKKRRFRPLFIIDLGLPRNLQPTIAKIDNVYLFNIDDLQGVAQSNDAQRSNQVQQGWQIIDDLLDKFDQWQVTFSQRQIIAEFRRRFNSQYLQPFADFIDQAGIDEKQKQQLRHQFYRLKQKILHNPTQFMIQNINQQADPINLLSIFGLDQNLPAQPPSHKIIDLDSVKKNKSGNQK